MKNELKWYLLFFTALLVFIWVAQFNGLYGQDSYEYLRYTKCVSEFIDTGANPGDYFWPMLYPIMGSIFHLLFPLPFALQFVSILSLVLSAIYLQKILIFLFQAEKNANIAYVFLFFLLSPYMLRGSLVVMSDSLTVLCITAAVYYFEKYKRTFSNKYFLALVFFSTAAISTRYAAFVILVPFIVTTTFIFLRNFKVPTLLVSIVITTLVFTPHLIIRSHSMFTFIHHEWFDTWSPFNFFRTEFDTSDGHSSYPLYNILYSFFPVAHPAFCFAGALLFIFCLRIGKAKWTSFKVVPIVISILLYALFMAGIPFQNLRYLLLSFPLVLILLFPGYESGRLYLKEKRMWNYCLISIVFIQLSLFCRVFIPFYEDNKLEKTIASKMLKYSGETLYTFSIDGALKSYGFKGKIINMWMVKLDTMRINDTNLFVLFNEKQFLDMGRTGNPMINWEYLNKQHPLVKIEDMPDGWALYSNRSIGKNK